MPDTRPGPPALTRRERLAAPASASADGTATDSGTDRESASASADVPTQFSVRVRPSTQRAITAYATSTRLKKGPATDALWNLLIRGAIDVKVVKDEIRKMRGEDE